MFGSLEHMAIAAKETGALAGWYRDTLGFEVLTDGGPKGIWFVAPPGAGGAIEIIPASDAARTDRARNDPGWSHLAFTVADFQAAHKALVGKGIAFQGEPRQQPDGSWIAFFPDPDGNVLQIVQRPKPLR